MSGGRRRQQTLEKPAEVSGFGFFSGIDVTLRFLPAPENHGVVFQRIDLPERPTVRAVIDNVQPASRRTVLQADDARVELVEHIMAALAGLNIDNVLIEIDAPEVPGCDGSCRQFCQELLDAGICEQSADVGVATVLRPWAAIDQDNGSEITARPHIRRLLAITYQLDYGHRAPVRPQLLSVELTPEVFLREISWARTFVLESEVKALRQAGFGRRVTEKDIVVFGADGVIGNTLRRPDECVRHKILDCIGDFALCGSAIHGHFDAWRSGHSQNHEVVRSMDEFACRSDAHRVAA